MLYMKEIVSCWSQSAKNSLCVVPRWFVIVIIIISRWLVQVESTHSEVCGPKIILLLPVYKREVKTKARINVRVTASRA